MEMKIKIEAPGLEGALHTLAQVLANYDLPAGNSSQGVVDQPVRQPYSKHPEPVQQQPQSVPVQQQPQQAQQQEPAQTQAPAQQQVPTSNPEYSMDQLAVAATQLMDAGKQQDLVNLLQQFGVQALTVLPKEQYGAFATKLREMGAKI